MSLLDLIEQYSNVSALGVFVLLTLIQVSPIKVDPWKMIARTVGKALNADMRDALDEHIATSARYRILRFSDEIRMDIKHSHEHFGQVLDDITAYEDFCRTHPNYKNNKAVMAIKHVKETYKKCTDENSFL